MDRRKGRDWVNRKCDGLNEDHQYMKCPTCEKRVKMSVGDRKVLADLVVRAYEEGYKDGEVRVGNQAEACQG